MLKLRSFLLLAGLLAAIALAPQAARAQAMEGEPCIDARDCASNCCVNGTCGFVAVCGGTSGSGSGSGSNGTSASGSSTTSSSGGSASSGGNGSGGDVSQYCPPNAAASSGPVPDPKYYEIDKNYKNNIYVKNECLPPTPGEPKTTCSKIMECENLSSNGGGSSSGQVSTRFMTRITSVSGETSSGSSSGVSCPGGQIPPVSACDPGYACSKNCVTQAPVCAEWLPGEEGCGCAAWLTGADCECEPSCTIQDPDKYPFCCSVEEKPGYPCIMVCTMPSGDKIDILENDISCKAFPDCCRDYGEPIETELGDPRDFCKIKCKDACDDWLQMDRPVPDPDFPECCTPPVPLEVACACCREQNNATQGDMRPPHEYCLAFLHFFDCNTAECALTDGNKCESNIAPSPVYDPDYDPYVKFDARYQFCSAPWANKKCRYICKGQGIILKENAPEWPSIWSHEYANQDGILPEGAMQGSPPYHLYENNYTIESFKNCDINEEEIKKVEWPPTKGGVPNCDSVF